MEQTSKPMYALLFYEEGKVVDAISTTDLKLARKEYQRFYRHAGIAPRLLIDGVRQPIYVADHLMRLTKGCIVRKKDKPRYLDRHHLMAKRKAP